MDDNSIVTLAIALWGAVTGTIGILLQIRAHLKDRVRLRVSMSWHLRSSTENGGPRATAVNIGRRPVHPESVLVRLRPPSEDLEGGVAPEDCLQEFSIDESNTALHEGEALQVWLEDHLPLRDIPHLVERVGVRDTTGKVWWSKRRAGVRALRDARVSILLTSVTVENPEPEGSVELMLFQDRNGYTLIERRTLDSRVQESTAGYRLRWLALSAFRRRRRALQTGSPQLNGQ